MAKQSRLSSKRVTPKPAKGRSSRPAARPVARTTSTASTARRNGKAATAVRASRADNHLDAMVAYQQGVEALQARDFRRATQLFKAIIDRFPEEKELQERVRLYLNVCQRQAAPPDRTPRTIEERVYAATLAINAGAYENGLSELQMALRSDADNDHVHYMLGVVYALRQDFAASLPHLQRAVELNPDNRFLALQDEDLQELRDNDPSFRTIVDAAFTARREPVAAPPQHKARTSR